MNAEKVLGIAVCAFACATGSAFANTTNSWFGVKPNDYDIGLSSVATNGVAVTVEDSLIKLDNDSSSALTFTPSNETPLSDGLVTITSSAVLTPSDVSDLASPVPGAQAGFAVAVDGGNTNFYGYASAGDNGDPAWIKLTGTPGNPEEATTFTIALNYRDFKVSFYQGDNLLVDFTDATVSEFSISNDFTKLDYLATYGSGSISSVTSQYEVAVAAYNNKKYGSGAEAVKAKGSGSGVIQDVDPNGDATSDPQAANGLYAWQCDALGVAKDARVPFKPAATVNGSITLQMASEIEDGLAATFNVYRVGNDTALGSYPSDAIQVPQEQGTYLIKPDQITTK